MIDNGDGVCKEYSVVCVNWWGLSVRLRSFNFLTSLPLISRKNRTEHAGQYAHQSLSVGAGMDTQAVEHFRSRLAQEYVKSTIEPETVSANTKKSNQTDKSEHMRPRIKPS